MTDQEKAKAKNIVQALRCSKHQAGRCFACYQTACAGRNPYALSKDAADAIEALLERVDALEYGRMAMLVKMHGDCGVCIHKDDDGSACAECMPDPQHSRWAYEGDEPL